MNVDGNIPNFSIREFVRRQKPILLLHASYVVDTRDGELLRDCMREGSIHLVGVDLAAEQEIPSDKHIMATRYPDRDYHLKALDQYLTAPEKNKATGFKLRYQK